MGSATNPHGAEGVGSSMGKVNSEEKMVASGEAGRVEAFQREMNFLHLLW